MSNLSTFFFYCYAFGIVVKKPLSNPKSLLIPTFSSKDIRVLAFTFRCVIYFKFIVVYGVSKWSNFVLLLVGF